MTVRLHDINGKTLSDFSERVIHLSGVGVDSGSSYDVLVDVTSNVGGFLVLKEVPIHEAVWYEANLSDIALVTMADLANIHASVDEANITGTNIPVRVDQIFASTEPDLTITFAFYAEHSSGSTTKYVSSALNVQSMAGRLPHFDLDQLQKNSAYDIYYSMYFTSGAHNMDMVCPMAHKHICQCITRAY